MTPAERAADTPKRCMQCRGAWAVGIILINGRRLTRRIGPGRSRRH